MLKLLKNKGFFEGWVETTPTTQLDSESHFHWNPGVIGCIMHENWIFTCLTSVWIFCDSQQDFYLIFNCSKIINSHWNSARDSEIIWRVTDLKFLRKTCL